MLTTEGATCLAIWVNWEGNSTAFGIVSGVASGAKLPVLGRAAFTPVLISVPITTPIASVNTIRVNESSFSVRNLSKNFMGYLTPALHATRPQNAPDSRSL